MLSFSIVSRGFPAAFFAAGAVFCFLALGGVFDNIVSSSSAAPSSSPTSSSSLSGFGRLLGTDLVFSVVWDSFLGAAFGLAALLAAGAFLGAAAFGFGLGFYSFN